MKGELHLKIKEPSFMSNHEGWSLRGRDCLVVRFTATYAISAHYLKKRISGYGRHHDWVRIMVFKATFNNISAISWRSVLLVGVTGVSGQNYRPAASH
jgi:hypothetical protein